MATDYEKIYKSSKNALGPPGKLVTGFFQEFELEKADILDVGCGQGRDALFIAQQGHRVVGLDMSATGIADMTKAARAQGLAVSGIVTDISSWQPSGQYDVILFDRILHMLAEADRTRAFARIVSLLKPGGHILIADEKPNIASLWDVLEATGKQWRQLQRNAGVLLVRHVLQT